MFPGVYVKYPDKTTSSWTPIKISRSRIRAANSDTSDEDVCLDVCVWATNQSMISHDLISTWRVETAFGHQLPIELGLVCGWTRLTLIINYGSYTLGNNCLILQSQLYPRIQAVWCHSTSHTVLYYYLEALLGFALNARLLRTIQINHSSLGYSLTIKWKQLTYLVNRFPHSHFTLV